MVLADTAMFTNTANIQAQFQNFMLLFSDFPMFYTKPLKLPIFVMQR